MTLSTLAKTLIIEKNFAPSFFCVQQIMHFWVILVKKTHRFLCSVRFQLQYPCIFLPIYLFPVKIRTKNQTNISLLFHSSWFLKCNLQNEIMYKLMYHFYSASLKNTSKEYLMYHFYRNLSKVPDTASIWCLLVSDVCYQGLLWVIICVSSERI